MILVVLKMLSKEPQIGQYYIDVNSGEHVKVIDISTSYRSLYSLINYRITNSDITWSRTVKDFMDNFIHTEMQ